MRRNTAFLAFLTFIACQPDLPSAQRNALEARTLTHFYTNSALADWRITASAAGRDCRVLHVRTSIIMDDAMVDALHFGAGVFNIYEGGIRRFSSERKFRGVAYTDVTEKTWTFDSVTASEAERLTPCAAQ